MIPPGQKAAARCGCGRPQAVSVFFSPAAPVLSSLEERETNQKEPNGYAYLLFLESGREYHYLNANAADLTLTESCSAALKKGPLHPSWLIHFDPDKVVSALGVTDKDQLRRLSLFLKREITVSGEDVKVIDAPINPSTTMGDFFWKMEFDSGVTYTISGTDYSDGTGELQIYTSDLNRPICYTMDEGVAGRLTNFVKNFH